jgi:hypothetical protein
MARVNVLALFDSRLSTIEQSEQSGAHDQIGLVAIRIVFVCCFTLLLFAALSSLFLEQQQLQ